MTDEELIVALQAHSANALTDAVEARIRELVAEVQAEHDRTDRWQDRYQDEADRAEKFEAEVARLRGLLRQSRSMIEELLETGDWFEPEMLLASIDAEIGIADEEDTP